jgi:membrane protein implicated in regulation of membrane protease activity
MEANAFIAAVQAWHWLAVGLALISLAVMLRRALFVWPAIGAWATGLAMLFVPLGFPAQLIMCALTGFTACVAATILLRPLR